MTRQFLGLYLLIAGTLAGVSWAQDALLQLYGRPNALDDVPVSLALSMVKGRLRGLPEIQWKPEVATLAASSGIDMELFSIADFAGRRTLDRLARGEIIHMQGSDRQSWALKQIDAGHVLVLKSVDSEARRGPLDWLLSGVFYAAIAFVIMIWLWPLRRDLHALEASARRFGDRNWHFNVSVNPRSPVHSLAATFRKMAARIDGLIASHRDMSNAVSHEIRTPLSRMQFEIELAQAAESLPEVRECLVQIKEDIGAIKDLVNATMEYAILERADVVLNMGRHDFSELIPAIAESARSNSGQDRHVVTDIRGPAGQVVCDVHLLESAYKNLLYNAMRFAKRDVRVTFAADDSINRLTVEDDGPGIPLEDRGRIFESFVQLQRSGEVKQGFGLGLAIVKRVVEWHEGSVVVDTSPLGGARFTATWPANKRPSAPV
ncbi:MAG TPA: ATP-binding protein [Steroidobacteraceae bacterium]